MSTPTRTALDERSRTRGIVGGLVLVALGTGAGAFGQVANQSAIALGFLMFLVAPVGGYAAADEFWHEREAIPHARARGRSVRLVSTWAFLVGAYLMWGAWHWPPWRMSLASWLNAAPLAMLTFIAAYGVIAVNRQPRAVAKALSVAASYSLIVAVNFLRVWRDADAERMVDSGWVISMAVAASFVVAIVVAFVLAWPRVDRQ
jgi:hypothetical protein